MQKSRLRAPSNPTRTMFVFTSLALLAASSSLRATSSPSNAPSNPAATVAVGQIGFTEGIWGRGSLPTLTFTVTGGRGPVEQVLAFLYISEEPEAFLTSPYRPQFVGKLESPSSTVVQLERIERGPINAFSREKFVQGALFDARTMKLVDVTNQEYLDIAYDTVPLTFTLDFETEDDFTTPLLNGQDLSTPPEFGRLVSLSAAQPALGSPHQGPAVFDSSPAGPNAGSSDPDLLVGLGNVLILQENPGQTVAGFFDQPDDSRDGGTLAFEFSGFDFIEKVEPRAIDLIDVDSAGNGLRVTLTDVLGRTRVFQVPASWTGDRAADGPPGFGTLDLTTLDPQPGFASTATATGDVAFLPGEVVRLEVEMTGSGAIDNLVFTREQDPGSVPSKLGRRSGPGQPRPR